MEIFRHRAIHSAVGRRFTGVTALVVAAGLLIGCGADNGAAGETTVPADNARGEAIPQEWADAVSAVENKYDGSVGLAMALPGAGLEADVPAAAFAGTLLDGPAWSTAKVPIGVAVLRERQEIDDSLEASLAWSDNEAAEALWNSLGDWSGTGDGVDEVLRDGGDMETEFQRSDDAGGSTPFGLTEWSLVDQATFGANLPCIDGGEEISQVMGHVVQEQRYGLGTIDGARFKGGWSPDDDGNYFVREFGVIPGAGSSYVTENEVPVSEDPTSTTRTEGVGTQDRDYTQYDAYPLPSSFLGISVAVEPGDGTYETAQEMLDELAAVIRQHPVQGGSCTA